jgi:hypothetical protein
MHKGHNCSFTSINNRAIFKTPIVHRISIFFPWLYSPWRTLAALHIGGFLSSLDIWQDSLDEWSARCKTSTYTGQQNTERSGQTSMPWAGFEPTIPATNRPRPTPQTARPLDESVSDCKSSQSWNLLILWYIFKSSAEKRHLQLRILSHI